MLNSKLIAMEGKRRIKRRISTKRIEPFIIESSVARNTRSSYNTFIRLGTKGSVGVAQNGKNYPQQILMKQGSGMAVLDLSNYELHTKASTKSKNPTNKFSRNKYDQLLSQKRLCQELLEALMLVSNKYKTFSTGKKKTKMKRNENREAEKSSGLSKPKKNSPERELLNNGMSKIRTNTGTSKMKSYTKNISCVYIPRKERKYFIEKITQLDNTKKRKNSFKVRQLHSVKNIEALLNSAICEQLSAYDYLFDKLGVPDSVRNATKTLNLSYSPLSKHTVHTAPAKNHHKIKQFNLDQETDELLKHYNEAVKDELQSNNTFLADQIKESNDLLQSNLSMKSSASRHRIIKDKLNRKFNNKSTKDCNNDLNTDNSVDVSIDAESKEKTVFSDKLEMDQIQQSPYNEENISNTYQSNSVKDPLQCISNEVQYIKNVKNFVEMSDPKQIYRTAYSYKKVNTVIATYLKQILKSLKYLKAYNSVQQSSAVHSVGESSVDSVEQNIGMSDSLRNSIHINNLLKPDNTPNFHNSRQLIDKHEVRSSLESNHSKSVQTTASLFKCKCPNSSNEKELISQFKNTLGVDETNFIESHDMKWNINLEAPVRVEIANKSERKEKLFLLSHCSKDSIEQFEKCCKQNTSTFPPNSKRTNLSDLDEEFSSCTSFSHAQFNNLKKTKNSSRTHLAPSSSVIFYSATSLCTISLLENSFSANSRMNNLKDSNFSNTMFVENQVKRFNLTNQLSISAESEAISSKPQLTLLPPPTIES